MSAAPIATMLRSRFRGCLVGGVMGDCLASPFEGDANVGRNFLASYLNKLLDKNKTLHIYSYTDDTAMMKSVAETLIECGEFDARDMARRFTEEFFRAPTRGYGSTVKDTFVALKESDYEEPLEPARHQFRGQGSLGNGAAMRTAPVALFGYQLSTEDVIELARNQSQITHSHPHGYNGAILQTLAVHQALKVSGSSGNGQENQPLNPADMKVQDFLDVLIDQMQKVEEDSPKVNTPTRSGDRIKLSRPSDQSNTPYTDALKQIKQVLADPTQGTDPSPEEIVLMLGNSVSAPKSVPTAIFCALRAHHPIPSYPTDDILIRALYIAISIGGDTDTIASMACSIVGALYGEEGINVVLRNHCEFHEQAHQLADRLYEKVFNVAA